MTGKPVPHQPIQKLDDDLGAGRRRLAAWPDAAHDDARAAAGRVRASMQLNRTKGDPTKRAG